MILGISFDILSDSYVVSGNSITDILLCGIIFNNSWTIDINNNLINGTENEPSFGIGAYNSMYMTIDDNEIYDFDIGIQLFGVNITSFDDENIYDCREGVNITASEEVTFTQGWFDNIEARCIVLDNCTLIDIYYTTFNNSATGIAVYYTNYTEILGCEFDELGFGINIYTCEDVDVENCTFYNILSAIIIQNGCDDIDIVGSICDSALFFVYAFDSSDIMIIYAEVTDVLAAVVFENITDGAILFSNITTGDNGICVTESNMIAICEVNITDEADGSIEIYDTDTVILLNNSFSDSGDVHVMFSNVSNATCIGNYFYTADYGDAWDDGTNTWYNETYGGNYWCNYTDYDHDGDGYGEVPYNITGGDNQDLYPIAEYVVDDENVGAVLYDLLVAVMPVVIMIVMLGVILRSINKTIKKE
jgi:nitrous oxidase accessory protein NosD